MDAQHYRPASERNDAGQPVWELWVSLKLGKHHRWLSKLGERLGSANLRVRCSE